MACAKVELSLIKPLKNYDNPKMDLAIIKIFWFERFQPIPELNFIKKYFLPIIPRKAPYINNIDNDHNLVELSREVGIKVYKNRTLEYATYLLGVGRTMNLGFNENLYLKERKLVEEVIEIFFEL